MTNMTSFLDEVDPQPALLVPRPSLGTKGTTVEAAQPIEGRLAVGGPEWHQVSSHDDSYFDARGFAPEELARYRFFVGHMTVTALHDDDEPFTQVNLNVSLLGDGSPDDAIAWSLAPDRMQDIVKLSREVSWEAGLKVGALGLEAGPGVGWKRGTEVEQKLCSLVAGGELTSDPSWRWRRTTANTIDGMLRLVLVVRTIAHSPARGQVKVTGTVERRRMGVFAYDARLPEQARPTFVLG